MIQVSNVGHIMEEPKSVQVYHSGIPEDIRLLLGFDDLQPCMAFILTLDSAWPHLERILIYNEVIIGSMSVVNLYAANVPSPTGYLTLEWDPVSMRWMQMEVQSAHPSR